MKKWVCKVCGYVHIGDSVPEVCPKCRNPNLKFNEQSTEFIDEILSVNDYFTQGNILYYAKDYKGAIECYSKVIAMQPNGDGAYFNRGLCFSAEKLLVEAYSDFENAVRINPKNKVYYETFSNYKKQYFYLVFVGLMKIILKFVGPLIGGFIGAKIGLGNDDFIKAAINGSAGIGTVIKTVVGTVVGATVVGIIGSQLFLLIGWIGNKKLSMSFDLVEMYKDGWNATDASEPL
jgi:tetratricopeptide (TPR) repeat protein